MKKFKLLPMFALLGGALAVSSCSKKEEATAVAPVSASADAMAQIKSLGFSTQDAKKVDGGYVVEGDMLLTNELLASAPGYSTLRVGQDEQYRTTNTVGGTRVITISVSNQLPGAYITAIDEVARRFNAENLRITFARVSTGGDISIVRASGSYLASAGFPTSAGEPFNQVKVNSRAIGTANPTTYIATILAHEVGHCIGFRHTDYTDRSYSCGGATSNEGASTVGAVLIPGTPAGPDPNSWMLACIGSGQNRPFNANDRTALNFIY